MTSSEQIDKRIAELADWRGQSLQRLREVIHKADPQIIEEWKWDTPIFTHNGLVCAISAFKEHVKINFFKGSSLQDKHKLFNNGFESKQHRAIDFKAGDTLKGEQLIDLIKEAVELNIAK